MKKNVFYAAVMMVVVMMTACSSNDDDIETVQPAPKKGESRMAAQAKTVLVYMAGRNSLAEDVNKDLEEMKQGSKRLGSNDNLLVFVRRGKTEKMPWMARIKNGVVTDSVSLRDMGITSTDGENRASDPVVMEGVMRYAYNHYPAVGGNYGLVLWGHGSGWLMDNEVKRANSRAFGVDRGEDGRALWMNIPRWLIS
jgi:hypothetical protein